jgi:exopolyphosphatase/guanosine-5'-triphosphate,3'-diphosphate pyrophosphatase
LGAVRLTETFTDPNRRGCYRFQEMRESIDHGLRKMVPQRTYHPHLMIGTGGTFTSLARAAILRGTPAEGGRFPFAVRGYELSLSEVRKLLDWLGAMTPEERRGVAGLSGQRAEIIVAGVCIVERLMTYLSVDKLRVHDGGIRDGLLAEMIDELHLQPEAPRSLPVDVVSTVRAFAERCNYDRAHAQHVRMLSLQIFDQLRRQVPDASGTWARRESRDLLEAAALVHDVGELISQDQHHRHSYDMIVHAELPGFTRREIEIIANIARYHRRKGPSPNHFNFRKLGDDDQRLVGHLVGILRVADGLDHTRTQTISAVRVDAEPRCVRFQAHAEQEPSLNLEYALRKADVFERAFHTQGAFSWTPVSLPVEAMT